MPISLDVSHSNCLATTSALPYVKIQKASDQLRYEASNVFIFLGAGAMKNY